VDEPIELSWAEADLRHSLQQYLQAWDDDAPVTVYTADAALTSLDLSEGNYVVAGNLTLTEDLCSHDESGFLVVLGNLDVRNVLSGGGQITVRGNVTARNGVHTDYNHGSMWVTGDLRAKVIAAEHELRIDGTLSGLTIDFGGFRVAGAFTPDIPRSRAVHQCKDVFVPGVFNSAGYVSGRALMDRLRDGLPILLDGRL
jgi:hypothetical protein